MLALMPWLVAFKRPFLSLMLAGFIPSGSVYGQATANLSRTGLFSWNTSFSPGTPLVGTIEYTDTLPGPWTPLTNRFVTNALETVELRLEGTNRFYRVRQSSVPPTPEGFTNLVNAYGILETIAGTGVGQTDGISYWDESFEGQPGYWASLSRPHYAQADRQGNIYIVDKNSHSVLKLLPDGTIHTHAGTHTAGYNGDGGTATNLQLNFPNGAWVHGDGTVYVLDNNNGRIRRIRNGVMTTLFLATNDGSPIPGGRGLWVNPDESLAYFCAGTRLRKWTPGGGLSNVATGFSDLGTLYVEPTGNILVCDRGNNYAYRVTPTGFKTIIAGNGETTGGGDGFPATQTGLDGVRSIWPLAHGGHLLLTHDGSQLWYMDSGGTIRLLLNGAGARTHSGDGWFFYTPEPKISEGRSVTVDYSGNIIITESDWGYVRRIQFLPTTLK
jgi:hypothetical protein